MLNNVQCFLSTNFFAYFIGPFLYSVLSVLAHCTVKWLQTYHICLLYVNVFLNTTLFANNFESSIIADYLLHASALLMKLLTSAIRTSYLSSLIVIIYHRVTAIPTYNTAFINLFRGHNTMAMRSGWPELLCLLAVGEYKSNSMAQVICSREMTESVWTVSSCFCQWTVWKKLSPSSSTSCVRTKWWR